MSKIEINKLTNANVYMNGVNLLGRAEEVQLPQINIRWLSISSWDGWFS